jgi:hypothetical protein
MFPHCTPPEEWRPVVGIRFYEVSNLGRVRSRWPQNRYRPRLDGPRLLNPTIGYFGYPLVTLWTRGETHWTRQGKRLYRHVHCLVAEAFLGPAPEGTEVNHIDNDPANNAVTNLEWITHADNLAHARAQGRMKNPPRMTGSAHWGARLTEPDIPVIRSLHGIVPQVDLARRFGVSVGAISHVQNGHTWRHVA